MNFLDGTIPVLDESDPTYKAWELCNTVLLSQLYRAVIEYCRKCYHVRLSSECMEWVKDSIFLAWCATNRAITRGNTLHQAGGLHSNVLLYWIQGSLGWILINIIHFLHVLVDFLTPATLMLQSRNKENWPKSSISWKVC